MDENRSNEQTVLERIGRERAMRAPLFGRRAEKAFRQRNADEFNYGGRTHAPDPDVADPEVAESEIRDEAEGGEAIVSEKEAQQSSLFSSPLPDHAFQTGDLNRDPSQDDAPLRGRQKRAMRPRDASPRRRVGRFFQNLFTRH